MIEVVIVEDEMLVRLGTKLCLEGYQGAIRVAEAFETAEEAIGYFREHTADVLITDIKLTGMSGLELIREVKPDHLKMRTIVLSCYEDFAYAREAMELGVDKYLLKHELSTDELSKAVTDLYQEGRVGRSVSRQKPEPGAEKNREETQGYVLGYLVLRGENDACNSGPNQLDFNILSEIIQKLMNVGRLGECFLRHEQELFLVFQMEKGTSREEFSEKLHNFFERLSRNIYNYFNKHTYLFLSEYFDTLNMVPEIYEITKKEAELAFYYEKSWMFQSNNLRVRSGSCPKLRLESEGAFTQEWFMASCRSIRSFFFEARKNLADVVQVKAEAVKYFYALEESLVNFSGEEKEFFSAKDYTSIDAFDSAVMLEKWFLSLLKEVEERLPEASDQVRRIEKYIQAHYQEELSLERVSEAFHMSMPYFCQYFKKHMGVNFVSYLNGFRIQKARELLRNPAFSTEQVAAAIGISNPNYFVRLFKKLTGQTVGTYRKSLKL